MCNNKKVKTTNNKRKEGILFSSFCFLVEKALFFITHTRTNPVFYPAGSREFFFFFDTFVSSCLKLLWSLLRGMDISEQKEIRLRCVYQLRSEILFAFEIYTINSLIIKKIRD